MLRIIPLFLSFVLSVNSAGPIYPLPPVAPVPGHPRLLVNETLIADLRARASANDPLYAEIEALAGSGGDLTQLRALAMNYLLSQDEAIGRSVIGLALERMSSYVLRGPAGIESRNAGALIYSGALVYDWCYDLLSASEKEQFIRQFVRISGQMESGWPPVKQSSITGHSSELIFQRDLMSVGIAIYDEDPSYYNLVAGRWFSEHLPARNFIYPGGMYHQGSTYASFRYSCDLWPLLMFERMGYTDLFDPSVADVPYFFIYSRRPDGSVLPLGDTTDLAFYPVDSYVSLHYMLGIMAASVFTNSHFQTAHIRQYPEGSGNRNLAVERFLFEDPAVEPGDLSDLPLTRYFGSPFGAMIVRTGWNPETNLADKASPVAMAYMEVGEYNFGNHDHADSGSFQLYYKGSLAIDSGFYQSSSGSYHSPHHRNYTKASIAHNTILVYDPNEPLMLGRTVNDGGQRAVKEPQTLDELLTGDFKSADVISSHFGPDSVAPDFSYLKGDITQAYGAKMSEFKRSFVFLNLKNEEVPAALIVFDKVVSSNPDFTKYWLLHSIEEPQVDGNRTTIRRTERGYNGKLQNYTFLPESGDLHIEKVGGPENEFDIFGTRMPAARILAGGETVDVGEQGKWRVQISPQPPVRSNLFLNVMLVSDADRHTSIVPEKFETETIVGTRIMDRTVVFSKNGTLLSEPFSFTRPDASQTHLLICDLSPGLWAVQDAASGQLIQNIQVVSGQNTLYIDLAVQTLTLHRIMN